MVAVSLKKKKKQNKEKKNKTKTKTKTKTKCKRLGAITEANLARRERKKKVANKLPKAQLV